MVSIFNIKLSWFPIIDSHTVLFYFSCATAVKEYFPAKIKVGLHGPLFAIIQSCSHTSELWHMATLALWTHSYSDLISLGSMNVHYAANSTTDNANFIHQVAHMSQSIEVTITIEGPWAGIHPRTSSPQGEHANHYTNGDSQSHDFQVSVMW